MQESLAAGRPCSARRLRLDSAPASAPQPMSAQGSLPPCGVAAISGGLPFRHLPLAKTAAPAAKLFKTFAETRACPGSCAIPSRTEVVPISRSSARSEPKRTNAAGSTKVPHSCTSAWPLYWMLTKRPDTRCMRILVVLLLGIVTGGVFAAVQLLYEHGLLSALLEYSLTGSAAMLGSALAFAFRQN